MILKSQARAPVGCVFMTDGATSHQAFMGPERIRRLRRAEALEATAVLGVAGHDVHFLDFPDSRLSSHHKVAVDRIAEIVEARRPEEVYVPYARDGTPDHEAAFRIVTAALHLVGRPVEVLEYPVWFWNQWPWVPLRFQADRITIAALARLARSGFGVTGLRQFRSGVFVAPVLERKNEALARYHSQVTRLLPETAWPTLYDVSGGAFLECLFQDFEVFRSSEITGQSPRTRPSKPSR